MMCEKCWEDAYMRSRFEDPSKSQAEHYADLLIERMDNPCTPDQQKHGNHMPEEDDPKA